MATDLQHPEPDLEQCLPSEAASQARLAPLWNAADTPAIYPAVTATVASVLSQGGGYDVSVEWLEDLVRSERIDGVILRGGQFLWCGRAMVGVMILCEVGRRYLPLARQHLHKLTGPEIVEAQARVNGDTGFSDLDQFDNNQIVEFLVQCNDPNMRRVFATALKVKLRELLVLDK